MTWCSRVNSETLDIATKGADEEEEVEDELVAAVGAHAQSGKTLFNYFYVVMLCWAHLTEQCAHLTILCCG